MDISITVTYGYYVCYFADRQTAKQTDGQTDRQTDRQTPGFRNR